MPVFTAYTGAVTLCQPTSSPTRRDLEEALVPETHDQVRIPPPRGAPVDREIAERRLRCEGERCPDWFRWLFWFVHQVKLGSIAQVD